MTMRPADFLDLGWLTLVDPRRGFRAVLDLRPSAEARWLALLLVSVLTVLVMGLATYGLTDAQLDPMTRLMRHPLVGIVLQSVTLVVVAAAIAGVGQRFGGTARFSDALTAIVWVEVVMLALQVVLIVTSLVMPAVAAILAILSVVIFVRLVTHATALVNGFENLLLVLVGIVVTLLAFSMVIVIVLNLLGIMPDLSTGAGNV